ncbi:hypothetical protein CAPTEDRAFT_18509 [Capitella teleta]|uniref:LIM zinc-binding domain-containing protein n=1 Tax=Capitella teleta TaxID=283909 RepID=R7TE05_CAPTE|nr:hypothetical protein CAPTEDRAFT_18509 [Capitella teleta]|eukprot:ELT89712.1 hypothetical protein CAPTEDRAFT_18509 [Capitella teleta]
MPAQLGGAPCCPRCNERVYFNEAKNFMSRSWHKKCFLCGECKKRLDPVSIADHKGEVFCKPCYGRLFGPKGYGYAGGAGNGLSMDAGVNSEDINNVPHTAKAYLAPTEDGKKADSERALEAGAELCPRCGMQVFIAEKKAAAGKAYHDRCFRCDSCEKKLDLGALSENMGKIYCKTCYGKNFGPKGYGYGVGGGTLQAQ